MYIFIYIAIYLWYGYYVAPPFVWDVFVIKPLLIYINIHNKWIFIWLQRMLGYKNVAVRLNVGSAKWAIVLADIWSNIEAFLAHYKMSARETNYVANFFKAYFTVQHFTFLLPNVNIDHLCRNCFFLCFDNLFTK